VKILNITIFCLLYISTNCAVAQEKIGPAIDALIQLKVPRAFNGSILISKNGQQLYQRSHGFRDMKLQKPFKINDQFLIGSISKMITAVLVLREVQAGHIQLNHPIRTYLPAYDQKWADTVTIQHLLHHSSGIVNWDKNLLFAPGTRFSYSNINYAILGKIIEKTSGQSYATLTKELFNSCQMYHSTVPSHSHTKGNPGQLVTGHTESGNGKYKADNILHLLDTPPMGIPAAGIISTAMDLTNWTTSLHTGKLLHDSTYKNMITNSISRPHRWGRVNYGDGIQIDEIDGIKEFSMSGYVPGFISTLIYYPASKITVVVLENISPDPSDMNRVFFYPDQIRELIRIQLLKTN